jgi:hypothetical protein
VLLLLVAVVGEDGAQLVVARRIDPLVVPVHRFQLLHQRDDGAMPVDGGRRQLGFILVQRIARLSHGEWLRISLKAGRYATTAVR